MFNAYCPLSFILSMTYPHQAGVPRLHRAYYSKPGRRNSRCRPQRSQVRPINGFEWIFVSPPSRSANPGTRSGCSCHLSAPLKNRHTYCLISSALRGNQRSPIGISSFVLYSGSLSGQKTERPYGLNQTKRNVPEQQPIYPYQRSGTQQVFSGVGQQRAPSEEPTSGVCNASLIPLFASRYRSTEGWNRPDTRWCPLITAFSKMFFSPEKRSKLRDLDCAQRPGLCAAVT
jgi:hypothetical protein